MNTQNPTGQTRPENHNYQSQQFNVPKNPWALLSHRYGSGLSVNDDEIVLNMLSGIGRGTERAMAMSNLILPEFKDNKNLRILLLSVMDDLSSIDEVTSAWNQGFTDSAFDHSSHRDQVEKLAERSRAVVFFMEQELISLLSLSVLVGAIDIEFADILALMAWVLPVQEAAA
jgi:hypothetical protein